MKNTKTFEATLIPEIHEQSGIIDGIGVYEIGTGEDQANSQPNAYPPAYDKFAPLDIIKVNKAVPLQFRSALPSENQVSQLIYANLKLKRLMEEYGQLQNRMHGGIFNSETGRKFSGTTAAEEHGATSWHVSQQALEQDRRELTRIASGQGYAKEKLNSILSISEFVEHNRDGLCISSESTDAIPDDQFKDNGTENSGVFSENGKQTDFENSGNMMNGRDSRKMRRETKHPPRVINVLAIAIDYFLNNKLEVAFYLFILSTIILALTSPIKR